MRVKNTFLTKAQLRVLELRNRGVSQAEVARMLKTSRANICILERRVRENIDRARETIKLAAELKSPVVVRIAPGEDILEVPKRLFAAADKAKIKAGIDTPALLARIREQAGGKLRGRLAAEEIELMLTSDGDVVVY